MNTQNTYANIYEKNEIIIIKGCKILIAIENKNVENELILTYIKG